MKLKISITILAVTLSTSVLVCTRALAQSHKPSERVQALWMGKWESGTVMPLLGNDLDKSGRVMRIKLDCLQEFLQPDGTEILAKDVRGGDTPAASAPGAANTGAVATAHGLSSGEGGGAAIGNSGFRPGDRVTAMWVGKKVSGVVVPMVADDLDKSGRVLRVKLDDLAEYLQPGGTEILAKDVQHSSAPPPQALAHSTAVAPGNTVHATPQDLPTAAAPGAGNALKRNTDSKTPAMNGATPNLTGTAWKMLYDQAVNVVPLIRFTKKGTYDTVRYGLGGGMQGNYRQNGSTVFLNNEAYSMNYNAGSNILLLTAGGTTLKLLYNGVTSD